METLLKRIMSLVEYNLDTDGSVISRKVRGVNLPVIDEAATNKNVAKFIEKKIQNTPPDEIISELKESVAFIKSLYMRNHDGFRAVKGPGPQITLRDIYCFSIGASLCFDFLPVTSSKRDIRVGIGLIAPAIQDCGKNLIKLVWKTTGAEIIDFGNTPAIHGYY